MVKVLLVPVALLLATSFSNTARADEAADAKKYKNGWTYTIPEGTGKFICMRPQGEGYGAPWREVSTSKNDKGNVLNDFVQVAKASDYVLLYDAKRQITIILTENASYIMSTGGEGARKLYSGKWLYVTY